MRTNEAHGELSQQHKGSKLRYSPPRLESYGRMRDVTAAGSLPNNENDVQIQRTQMP